MPINKDIKTVSVIRGKNDPTLKVDEENEKVEVMGQESETKAAKWVIEENREQEVKENEARAAAQSILEEDKRKKFLYKATLVKEILRQQKTYDLPVGFKWGARPTEEGVMVWFKDLEGNIAAVGMKPSGKPMYDLNWIDRRLNDALNTMERIDYSKSVDISLPHETKTAGGIIIPKK